MWWLLLWWDRTRVYYSWWFRSIISSATCLHAVVTATPGIFLYLPLELQLQTAMPNSNGWRVCKTSTRNQTKRRALSSWQQCRQTMGKDKERLSHFFFFFYEKGVCIFFSANVWHLWNACAWLCITQSRLARQQCVHSDSRFSLNRKSMNAKCTQALVFCSLRWVTFHVASLSFRPNFFCKLSFLLGMGFIQQNFFTSRHNKLTKSKRNYY